MDLDPFSEVAEQVVADPSMPPGWKAVIILLLAGWVMLLAVCAHLHRLKESNWREYAADIRKMAAALAAIIQNERRRDRD